ncbi:hypothetical protein KXR83_05565 [Williamsia muralis]|uniref:hypothetical protein n=1 Tax=Williamsia marianensis TaxID=85044 RepID=UPI003F137C7E
MPTLDELIGERKRLRGFSYADLENRADAVISRQRWQQLGTGVRVKEFPEPATITAMAKALDVDVAEVVLAAARSIGLDVKRGAQSDLAARLPSTADRLNEVQRDAIVTLVRSITEATNGMETTQKPDAPRETNEDQEAKVYALNPKDQADELDDPEPDYSLPNVAYTPKLGEKGSKEARDQDELAERPDPEGPEEGV